MNTNDIEAFLAVIETGSIMAAAARLNLTQPGVTRRVQNLEEHLGVALFERPAKPLKPTLAGREAYEHGRRVLQSIEALRSGASPNGAIRGELRLGVTLDLSEHALAAPIDALRETFPELTVRLTSAWSPILADQVARNQIDAAALTLPETERPPEGLDATEIAHRPLVIVAGNGLDLPVHPTLADLARLPWITSQDGCGFRTTLRRRFEAAGLPFSVGVEVPGTELRLSLVARNIGLGLVARPTLERSTWAKRLRRVDVPGFDPVVRSWIIHRSETGRLRRPIQLFREALQNEMGAPARSAAA